ncbi:hypothetical protein ACIBCA_00075 [Kitasatospora sp. NPDC051170]|uniref:hypothetical protein n=1 Tax=Kitasatospora sp. NPDC051170 TaxID=3364056 RepID=UPI00379428E6
MINELSPRSLVWSQVAPAPHPFDAEAAPQVVRSLGPALRVPVRPDLAGRADWTSQQARPWADAMSHALIVRYGAWAAGWRWAIGEGDFDGGPVGAWCCPPHSVTTPEETVDRVVEALGEWRGWLEDLAERFDRHPLDLASAGEDPIRG